jgi:hypothetical protein
VLQQQHTPEPQTRRHKFSIPCVGDFGRLWFPLGATVWVKSGATAPRTTPGEPNQPQSSSFGARRSEIIGTNIIVQNADAEKRFETGRVPGISIFGARS